MKRLLLLAVVILFAATLASAAPFKIALSNSFMGNDWRQEMEKVTQAVANKQFFKSQATLTIINCDNSPEAQSDSIDSLVKQGYQAILVDASSPTALNPAIDRAIKAGIVIVSFDQVVDHPQAWKLETDFDKIPADPGAVHREGHRRKRRYRHRPRLARRADLEATGGRGARGVRQVSGHTDRRRIRRAVRAGTHAAGHEQRPGVSSRIAPSLRRATRAP